MSCSCPFFYSNVWISPSNIASPPQKKGELKLGIQSVSNVIPIHPRSLTAPPLPKLMLMENEPSILESWKPLRLFRGKLLKASEVYTLPMFFFWSNTTSLRSSGNKHHPFQTHVVCKTFFPNREAEQKKRSHIWGGFLAPHQPTGWLLGDGL